MSNNDELMKKAKYYKEVYPPGTRLELIHMEDPYHPVEPGTRGTVRLVDDMCGIHLDWDNGRTLALVPEVDQFRQLTTRELAEEQQRKGSLDQKIHAADMSAPHIPDEGRLERSGADRSESR